MSIYQYQIKQTHAYNCPKLTLFSILINFQIYNISDNLRQYDIFIFYTNIMTSYTISFKTLLIIL